MAEVHFGAGESGAGGYVAAFGELGEPPWPVDELRRLHAQLVRAPARRPATARSPATRWVATATPADGATELSSVRSPGGGAGTLPAGTPRAAARRARHRDSVQARDRRYRSQLPPRVGTSADDLEWPQKLDEVLRVTRDPGLRHGTASAYAAGCVCRQCRDYNRERGLGRRRQFHAAGQRVSDGGE